MWSLFNDNDKLHNTLPTSLLFMIYGVLLLSIQFFLLTSAIRVALISKIWSCKRSARLKYSTKSLEGAKDFSISIGWKRYRPSKVVEIEKGQHKVNDDVRKGHSLQLMTGNTISKYHWNLSHSTLG